MSNSTRIHSAWVKLAAVMLSLLSTSGVVAPLSAPPRAAASELEVRQTAPTPVTNPERQPSDAKSATPKAHNPSTPKTAAETQACREKAWGILREALQDESTDKRARAVNALGLLLGNAEAQKAAKDALKDEKANVRLAAAAALGSMRAESAKPDLERALEDSEPAVALAAANSLLLLKDDSGYDVYYAVLTGEKRANKGLIKEQLQTLHDPKKMAQLGLEEGIGFIPFAGFGYEIFKTVTKDDISPVRAAAAKKLAQDPHPSSAGALVTATADKSWTVRAAALEAISQRGDRALLPKISPALDDEKDVVRFTAAACAVHLSEAPAKKQPPRRRTISELPRAPSF